MSPHLDVEGIIGWTLGCRRGGDSAERDRLQLTELLLQLPFSSSQRDHWSSTAAVRNQKHAALAVVERTGVHLRARSVRGALVSCVVLKRLLDPVAPGPQPKMCFLLLLNQGKILAKHLRSLAYKTSLPEMLDTSNCCQ